MNTQAIPTARLDMVGCGILIVVDSSVISVAKIVSLRTSHLIEQSVLKMLLY